MFPCKYMVSPWFSFKPNCTRVPSWKGTHHSNLDETVTHRCSVRQLEYIIGKKHRHKLSPCRLAATHVALSDFARTNPRNSPQHFGLHRPLPEGNELVIPISQIARGAMFLEQRPYGKKNRQTGNRSISHVPRLSFRDALPRARR